MRKYKYFVSYYISEINKFGNCELMFRKIKSMQDVNEISDMLKNTLSENNGLIENIIIINWIRL